MYFDNNSQVPAVTRTGSASSELVNMVQSLPYIDDQTRALASDDVSLFRRIFPSAAQRIIAKTRDEAKVEALRKLYRCMDLLLQEELDDRLIRGSANIRAVTIKEVQEKLVDVSEDLSRNQQRFITAFQKNLDFCGNIKSSLLKEKYQKALEDIVDESFQTFEKLFKHFSQFLDMRLGAAAPARV